MTSNRSRWQLFTALPFVEALVTILRLSAGQEFKVWVLLSIMLQYPCVMSGLQRSMLRQMSDPDSKSERKISE